VIQALATLVAYSLACVGLGAGLLRLLARTPPFSVAARLASAFLMGQGLLASAWTLLVLTGWFTSWLVAGVLVVSIAVTAHFAWSQATGLPAQLGALWHDLKRDTWAWKGVAGLTALLWIASLGLASGALHVDAGAFYMALAKVMAASGRLAPLPGYESFTQIGLQGEMHYAALIALGSPQAARLLTWPTLVAGIVLLVALCSRAGLGRRGQLIALAMTVTSSAVLHVLCNGKVDLFATGLGLAAYAWATVAGAEAVTGLLTGWTLVAKFSYTLPFLPGVGLLAACSSRQRTGGRAASGPLRFIPPARATLQLVAFTAFAMLPHMIKNGVLFGNPLLPLFGSEAVWANPTWFGPRTTRRILLTYPLALTFGQYWAQGGGLSPLILAFIPLALLLPRPSPWGHSPLVWTTGAALAGVLTWAVLRPSLMAPRYLLATLLLLVPLAARAAEYVSTADRRPRWLAGCVLACLYLSLGSTALGSLGIRSLPTVVARHLTGEWPECEGDGIPCRAMAALNRKAAPGDRVLLLSYPRYWLRPDLLQCVNAGDEVDFSGQPGAEALWLKIRERGFRYLIIDRNTHAAEAAALDLKHAPPWLWLIPMFRAGMRAGMEVYRLHWLSPPRVPTVTCRRVDPPAWDVVGF
jgi:hypothetical protein